MKKNKPSIIFAILTIICIFSIAAITDQCGCRATTVEEKIDVVETGENVSSKEEEEISEELEEEQIKEAEDELSVEIEAIEEETTETQEDEMSEEQEQTVAPTIELEIYEGPLYSPSDNVCYYRIKANVTGAPSPDVEFSKDDSGGTWGKFKCQINLDDPADAYTLIATATNLKGDATDSIDLSWGCNRPPEIVEITIHSESGIINPGQQYEISVEASDPDGDDLQYEWKVSGGKIDSPGINPIQWVTPSSVGEYQIGVEVEDGSGGMATISKTVNVGLMEVGTNINLPIMQGEGGYIVYNQRVITGSTFYTGDSNANAHCRAFISFNIRDLSGGTIDNAAIYFDNEEVWGNPSFFKIFEIYSLNWGAVIELSDYNTPGELIVSYPLSTGPDFYCNNSKLKMELQQAIDSGRIRFQIMIDLNSATTNGNSDWDGVEYDVSGVNLIVDYSP